MMGKISFGRVLGCLCISSGSSSNCFCINSYGTHHQDDQFERKPLVNPADQLTDIYDGPKTLAFQLKPKIVVLKVSMHCNGCARKVEKHISKMEGVTSYKVDLDSKMVVVIGDIVPFEVLDSVSRVKSAELWTSPSKSI
ncbi:hypothetical protein LguiA_019936 [Lonicera macranthoides]